MIFFILQDDMYDVFWNGPPFLVDGDSTEFSLVLSGRLRHIYYPLRPDREYSVTVCVCVCVCVCLCVCVSVCVYCYAMRMYV